MGRVEIIFKAFLFLLILISFGFGCNPNKKSSNFKHDIFLFDVAIDCANSNLTQQKLMMHDNADLQSESIKELNSKLRVIFSVDNVIRKRFFDMIDHRTTSSYQLDEVNKDLDYFKNSMIKLLDNHRKESFEEYLEKVGYYEGIQKDYTTDEELKCMLKKKYLTLKLATIEVIYLLYS